MVNEQHRALDGLYVKLSNDVRLHVNPVQAIITQKHTTKHSSLDVARMLSLCDGTKTLVEILNLLKLEYHLSPNIIENIVQLGVAGILEIHDTPSKSKARITGSESIFYPQHISVEMTNYCNLKCKHCYGDFGPNNNTFIDSKKLLTTLTQAYENGLSSVELTGGECTTHPEFNDVLQFCLQKFDVVAFLTNGAHVSDETIKILECADKHRYVCQINFDGSNEDIHDELRGKGSFQQVLEVSEKFKESGVNYRAAMNLHKGNVNDVLNTLDLAYRKGARWFSYSTIVSLGRAKEELKLASTSDLQKVKKKVNDAKKSYPPEYLLSEYDRLINCNVSKKIDNCGAGWRSITISPDGESKICLMADKYNFFKTNFLEQDYELSISQLPTNLLHNLKSPSRHSCEECSYCLYCVGCYVRALDTSSSFFGNEGCRYINQFFSDLFV